MKAFALVLSFLVVAGCDAPRVAQPIPLKPAKPSVRLTQDFAIPVLMYHRICDLSPRERKSPLIRDLSVSPADFEAQIKFLKENDFEFLFVSEVERALSQGIPLPERAVAITMDDGYRDNFTQAFPILKRHGAKATTFMVTNNFDRPERLSWTDAHEMMRGRVSFQSHSVSHPDLTTLAPDQLRRELVDSKGILERGLDTVVTSLAYPAGAFNTEVEVATERAGYLAAWKKGGGAVQPLNASNLFRLPRIRIHGRTDLEKFKLRVTSGVAILAERRAARKLVAMKTD